MTNTKALIFAGAAALLLTLSGCGNAGHYDYSDGGTPARQQMGGPFINPHPVAPAVPAVKAPAPVKLLPAAPSKSMQTLRRAGRR